MLQINKNKLEEARDRFHFLLTKNTKESEWQTLFTECPYVLTPSLPLRLEPRDIVPLGRPGRTEPDLIFYPHGPSPADFYGVIELKRHDQKIATITRENVAILTRNAETAVNQAQAYCHSVPDFIPSELRGGHLFLGDNKYLFVIMGMAQNEIIFRPGNELYREMIENRLPGNLRILPFDILLQNFEKQIYRHIHVLVPIISKIKSPVKLRSTPLKLSYESAKNMIQDKGFYERDWNWIGKGIEHQYEILDIKDNGIIVDHTTDLVWQEGGSPKEWSYENAKKWIKELNEKGYANCHDWRLPTMEEAMSLMEPQGNNDGLYINSKFSYKQDWIWTCDEAERSRAAWVVGFAGGKCVDGSYLYYGSYVRAVRS
jgi:hypothetical protein